MIVVHGISYEELALQTGVAVGTAKSRVFRARRQLQAWLLGDETSGHVGNHASKSLLLAQGDDVSETRLPA